MLTLYVFNAINSKIVEVTCFSAAEDAGEVHHHSLARLLRLPPLQL